MASGFILASVQNICSSCHVMRNRAKPGRALGAKQAKHDVPLDIKDLKIIKTTKELEKTVSKSNGSEGVEGEVQDRLEMGPSTVPSFEDARWKRGTWDLSSFVKDGKMDWYGVIVAEARRRKFLQVHPQPSTSEEPVLFRSSIIPWWAWLTRFHLPEAELLNGRAAMVGFFMAYLVDGLTGIGLVDQTGNSICKACLLAVVGGIIVFRQSQDFGNLRRLTDEYKLYEQQWRATYEGTRSSEDQEQNPDGQQK